ncbi:MAG: carboxypeptidase regulatory-like domain-containing protein [Rhodothermales bacterium]|nr:carboxypeptidase regulatory-like domain-containing protein [Rhodothermales bacterium]
MRLLAAALTLAALAAALFALDRTISGTVTAEGGAPLPGAFVSAYGPEGVRTTTYTDAAGRFALPVPPARVQHLEASAGGFAPGRAAPEDGPVPFTLRPAAAPGPAPSAHYLGLLPDGEDKRRFILDCTGCHQFDHTIVAPGGQLRSPDDWHARIEQMISFAGGHSSFPIMAPSRDALATTDWLAAHLGGPGADPPRLDTPPPAVPDDPAAVITEYDVPEAQDLPHDLALLRDGRVLVTGMMTHQMYTLDPADGAWATHAIPIPYANPRAVMVDEAGHWWVLLGYPRQVARYDPAADAWTAFDVGMYPHSIARDAGGRVWFNGHFTKNPEQIGVLDPAGGEVTPFDVPAPPMPDGGSTIPYGLRFGPDGTLWGTQLAGNRLVRFDPSTARFTLYPLPTPVSGPRRLDVAPDGTVWIPAYAAGLLVRFDPTTETFTEYALPTADALPYIVRVDAPRGRVWIATAAADAVFRFDLATEAFATYPLPTPRALVRHMALDAATGAVWLAYGNSPAVAPKIARLMPGGGE